MTARAPERIEIMEVPVTIFDSYEHASRFIIQSVLQGRRTSCVAINPIKVYTAWKDRQLSAMIHSAEFCVCDGIGMAAAVRLLYGRAIHRITGIQLFFDLLTHAEAKGLRIFLLGARPHSNEKAYEKLRERYPKLQVVGRNDGYFRDSEAVVRRINDSQADMLFVAMGSPHQEKWLARNRDRIEAPFCMGIGGSLDVLGGTTRRAPRVFQRTGTEWLYRLIVHPRRFHKQIVLLPFALTLLWRFLVAKVTRVSQVSLVRPLKVGRTIRVAGFLPDDAADAASPAKVLGQKI